MRWTLDRDARGFKGVTLSLDESKILSRGTIAAVRHRHAGDIRAQEHALFRLRDAILGAQPWQRSRKCKALEMSVKSTNMGLAPGSGWGYERVRARILDASGVPQVAAAGRAPHPWCSMERCFNATTAACGASAGAPLPVYLYNSDAVARNSHWLNISDVTSVVPTRDPAAACFFMWEPFHTTSGGRPPKLRQWDSRKFWRAVDGGSGRNHVLLNANCEKKGCDRPGELRSLGSLGSALLAAENAQEGTYRPGFDLLLPISYNLPMERLLRTVTPDVGAKKSVLYAFRGSFKHGTRTYDMRALMHVFAPARDDVVVDVMTIGSKDKCRQYDPVLKRNYSYDFLMGNCYFCLAPGGRGPYTFRFLECLSAGSVPVVAEDLLLPFQDWESVDLPWEACVVRVAPAEVRALSAVLLAVAPPGSASYTERLSACLRIRAKLFGSDPAQPSVVARWRSFLWDELAFRIRRARAQQLSHTSIATTTGSAGGVEGVRVHEAENRSS